MIEIHGLRCLKDAAKPEPDGTEIMVQDAQPHVRVTQRHCTFPALLTPDEADWLAGQLRMSAARIRKNQNLPELGPTEVTHWLAGEVPPVPQE